MIRSLPTPFTQRSGATLTEVLMAIFVMSIGVVSVITLFPLAILRAVHATQLTNSKMLEDNIEEFIHANPWLLRGSPIDRRLDPTPASSDFVNFGNRACVIDPLAAPIMNAYSAAYSKNFGNRGGAALPFTPVRRINPLGVLYDTGAAAASTSYDGTFTAWSGAEQKWMNAGVLSLPDSSNTLGDDLPDAITATSVTFPSTGPELGSNVDVRLTLITLDGTRSITRLGDTANFQFTLKSTEPNIPLPDFGLANVGRAVVDAGESRYSWVITCPAPADAPPLANCAVFFRRSFDPDEEFVYDKSGTAPVTAASSSVDITWGASDPAPLLREGNYLFDAQNAFWYRIRSYTRDDLARTAAIEIDRPARKDGRGIILPHGLIHVFDLEVRGQQ